MTSSLPTPVSGADARADLRLAWGRAGALADLGITVLPHGYDGAAAFALAHGATLARPRHHVRAGDASLSPGSLRAGQRMARLGAAFPERLHDLPRAARGRRGSGGMPAQRGRLRGLAGRPAGRRCGRRRNEHWPDGTLRPALEDLLGAGAVLTAALTAQPARTTDADAADAAAAYRESRPLLRSWIRGTGSARELQEAGFADDVEVALELDASPTVPVLSGAEFGPQP